MALIYLYSLQMRHTISIYLYSLQIGKIEIFYDPQKISTFAVINGFHHIGIERGDPPHFKGVSWSKIFSVSYW